MDDIARSCLDRANMTSKIATIKLLLKLEKSIGNYRDLGTPKQVIGYYKCVAFYNTRIKQWPALNLDRELPIEISLDRD